MSAGILDGFQTIIPTAAAVLSGKRQILRLTQQEVADRAKITLRQYQRLESGERNILTSSFGLACRVIEALDMDVSKFYHGDYYLEEEVKTMRGNSCRYCLGLRRSLNIAICLDFLSISVSRCSYFLPSRGIIDRIH